jgi:alanine racemase
MYIKPSRQLIPQPHRNAWVELNMGALERNARWWRSQIPEHAQAMAVVKADAYGHGAVLAAPILKECGFTWLGVSNIDEALQLREAKVEIPILVLGASPEWAWNLASRYDIQLTVFSERDIACLADLNSPISVHIKVDTGMHRIGVTPEKALGLIRACQTFDHVTLQGIFTHFANGEDAEKTFTQWTLFERDVLDTLDSPIPMIHATNTPSLLTAHTNSRYQTLLDRCTLYRVGVGLYGYEISTPLSTEPERSLTSQHIATPSARNDEGALGLEPVIGLRARISHVQMLDAGEGISYGHRYQTLKSPSCIVTLPIGYADGIPRGLSGKINARCKGVDIPQVGNITMDQLMLDATVMLDSGNAPKVGDIVTLLEHGEAGRVERERSLEERGLSLRHWAHHMDSIAYEMMCGLRVRLPRSVVR